MEHPAAAAMVAMAMAAVSLCAQAQGTIASFTSKEVNVRAGPARDSRGCVYAGNTSYPCQGASVR
jgi:uncharacterized protein YraI